MRVMERGIDVRIVVTGGAGYIGSHMTALLRERGHDVVVVDDLSAGFRDAVAPGAKLVVAKVSAPEMRDACEGADAVVHFAGRIQVGESVIAPRKYWHDNFVESLAALEAVLDAKVGAFVFSSTAAVYGSPQTTPIPEDHPTRRSTRTARPSSRSSARSKPTGAHTPALGRAPLLQRRRHARRASRASRAGDAPHPARLAAAQGGAPSRSSARLADARRNVHSRLHPRARSREAHLAAIEHLSRRRRAARFNLGSGTGTRCARSSRPSSVATGRTVPLIASPRRAGDPAVLVATIDRAAACSAGRQANRPRSASSPRRSESVRGRSMARPTLSLVIPIYNEEEVLPRARRAARKLLDRSSGRDREVVFVDDGSQGRARSSSCATMVATRAALPRRSRSRATSATSARSPPAWTTRAARRSSSWTPISRIRPRSSSR